MVKKVTDIFKPRKFMVTLLANEVNLIFKLFSKFIKFQREGLKINFDKTKVMESGGGSGIVVLSKIDLCGVCGKRAKVNCVRCKTFKKWVHARCARVKRVSCKMNGSFECRACMNVSNKVCNNVLNVCLSELEKVNSYCYLEDNMNGVTCRIELGWKAFNGVSSMLCGKRHMEY